MIRPEVAALLLRWREVIVALAVAAFGIWVLAYGLGRSEILLQACGLVLLVGALGVARAAFLRLRFAESTEGPGIVLITERQILYMGPHDGAATDLDGLRSIAVRHDSSDGLVWVLDAPGQPPLEIPAGARGAEKLFDAFTALPGLDPADLLRARQEGGREPRIVWRRAASRGLDLPPPSRHE